MKFYNKKHKFGAKKTEIDGIVFDSKGEAQYYQVLKTQEKLGLIKNLELQPKIYLSKARILYRPDFKFERDGETVYQDFKGYATPSFNIKMRLWRAYSASRIEIIQKHGSNFMVTKKIEGEAKYEL